MRRRPRQQRSRDLVEHLLDATAATLATRGLDNTTTNHIAEKAGVSIGSLYQYFPDKEAVIAAMMARVGERISRDFQARATQIDINRVALRDVVTAAIVLGLHRIRKDPLLRELMRNWNRLPIEKVLDPIEQLFLRMAQPYFLKNFDDYPVANLEAKLFVAINAALLTGIRYLMQDPSTIREREFVATLTDMIVGLLADPGGAGRARRRPSRATRARQRHHTNGIRVRRSRG
jgi:AcrR family transcriptional regulator